MVRVRFAGSPTGDPHIGNIRTAIFNWLFARRHKGKFIVRVEDTDVERSNEESMRKILEALRWLGLDWDEGPEVGGPHTPYFQSQRLEIYQKFASELVERGLAYKSYFTPEDIERRRAEKGLKPGVVDRGLFRHSPEDLARLEQTDAVFAVRFAIPEGKTEFDDLIRGHLAFDHSSIEDLVLIKSDGYPTYNFAVVVDDVLMEITHVIRGEEHISNTPKQILIYQAFGWPMPQFAHLPIILAKDRSKLSKRKGAPSIAEYRSQGYLPEAVLNYLALLGWAPGEDREIVPKAEMMELFDLDRITKSGAIYDEEKMRWVNSEYMRRLSARELAAEVSPFAGVEADDYLAQLCALHAERAQTLVELAAFVKRFYGQVPEYHPESVQRWLSQDWVRGRLEDAERFLGQVEPFEPAQIESATRSYADQKGIKAGEVFHPLRVACFGHTVGAGLFESLHLLGREKVLARVRYARQHVAAQNGTN